MTGYQSKKAAARDKLDDDDDAQIYQTELTKLLMESYDRGVADALEETKAALAQPAQEPVAWLCKADENGLFGLPTADKACKDCFPVYRQLPQRTVQVSPLEFVEMVMDKEHLVGNPIVWAQWPNKEKNT